MSRPDRLPLSSGLASTGSPASRNKNRAVQAVPFLSFQAVPFLSQAAERFAAMYRAAGERKGRPHTKRTTADGR